MEFRIPPLMVPAVLLSLAACAEMTLPDLTIPLGEDVTFGTDPTDATPVLGVTVTDPFGRVHQ